MLGRCCVFTIVTLEMLYSIMFIVTLFIMSCMLLLFLILSSLVYINSLLRIGCEITLITLKQYWFFYFCLNGKSC